MFPFPADDFLQKAIICNENSNQKLCTFEVSRLLAAQHNSLSLILLILNHSVSGYFVRAVALLFFDETQKLGAHSDNGDPSADPVVRSWG